MAILDMALSIGSTALSMSIPLLLAALGGMFSARVGIMALGLEGMMLAGAFGATAGTYFSGSPAVGLLCAVAASLCIALLHGLLTIRFHVNHIISGVGLNFLSLGMTTLLMQLFWKSRGNSPQTASFSPLFNTEYGSPLGILTPITVFTIFALLASIYIFKRTVFGFHLIAVGENPSAAATAGIPVNRYKFIGMTLCGILSGFSGAFLSTDHLNMFVREMTAGRGYIAVVINILGNYRPGGIFFSSLLFGFADSLQINLQGYGVPSQLIQMIPYIITLAVLVIAIHGIRPPKSLGQHFTDAN
jgi:simple sugar transport system permease protein